VSRLGTRSTIVAAVAAVIVVAGCGSQPRQDAYEPSGNYTVDVLVATFPPKQRLAEHTNLVITVRNTGTKTIPNIAVTILDPKEGGAAAQAFGQLIGPTPGLASRSRPIWIIDRPPGPCNYSCQNGGPGGAVTSYTNTWALGSLKPGASATFDWGMTAVEAGTHVVEYQIAAGLNGKAKAVLASGRQPTGTFTVKISSAPQRFSVNAQGQIITSH